MTVSGDIFPGIYLGNGEERAKERPKTFEIPDAIERRSLQVGDFAKLMFLSRTELNGCSGERIWVKITARTDVPARYTGEVDNNAAYLPIPFGGVVEFGPEHVIDIERVKRSEPASTTG